MYDSVGMFVCNDDGVVMMLLAGSLLVLGILSLKVLKDVSDEIYGIDDFNCKYYY